MILSFWTLQTGGPMPNSIEDLQPIPSKIGARHVGSNTLLRAQSRPSPEELDIAIAGVPFDLGTFGRPGSRLGPAQVRNFAWVARPVSFMTGVAPFEMCRIADVGDAPVVTQDNAASVESIQDFFWRNCRGGSGTARGRRRSQYFIAHPSSRGKTTTGPGWSGPLRRPSGYL